MGMGSPSPSIYIIMAEVTIKLDSPIITTDKSISEITTDSLANTGEMAMASDGIVGNVNGKLRKYPNPIKTFYVEKFVATGAAKWGFEPKDVKTNDVVMIKTATETLMFTVAEATNSKATLCAFTKNGGTRIVTGQKIGGDFIGTDKERVADGYTGITYEYSLSEDLSLTDVNPFTIGQDALKCVPSYYTKTVGGKSYLKLSYNKEYLLPIGASYKNYNCVFYFIIKHKEQWKLVALHTSAPNLYEPITTSLSFADLAFSPFNLTIGKTTKQINGTEDVSFSADEIGGASPMVAARLRLGVNKTGQHFRIHGKGLLPTDEVRLYRNVHSISHWYDSPDGTSQNGIKRKGWREVKYLGQGENYIAFPYLELATDVMENSPLANEVNVLVRVEQNGQDVYTGELIDFFVDYYLYVGTGNNHDEKDALYIRNGRKTKKVRVDSSTGEYFSTARTVDWAVLVLRDGNPITDFMPFKWLVETALEISAPMDIQACIDDTLKVSAVPYNHYAGNGASGTVEPVELPNLDVVTKLTRYSNSSSEAFDIKASNVNLKTGAVNTISAFSIPSATYDTMGLITSGMVQRIELLYADYIQRKYSGQNVVVLEYDPSRYKGSTAHFNGKEYALNGSLCVFDLGDKKVINNTTDDEQTFVSAITNVLYLPEGITNYDYAFHPLNSNNYTFRVSAKIDMSQCKSAQGMFATQAGFRHIDTSDWDMRNVENLRHAFYGAHLYELDASRWNTEKCTSFNGIFVGAFGLGAKIDLSGVSLQSATDVNAMFFGTYPSCYITLGKNFFNAPNINAFQLKYVPLSAELKQSLIDCFDRKAAGQQTLTLSLPTEMLFGVTALTEEEKAAIKAKGYELA